MAEANEQCYNMITGLHHTLTPTDTYGRFQWFISNKENFTTDDFDKDFTIDDFDKGLEANMAREENNFRRRRYETEINRQFHERLHRNLLWYAGEERRMIELDKNYQHRPTINEQLLPHTKGTTGTDSDPDFNDSGDNNGDKGNEILINQANTGNRKSQKDNKQAGGENTPSPNNNETGNQNDSGSNEAASNENNDNNDDEDEDTDN